VSIGCEASSYTTRTNFLSPDPTYTDPHGRPLLRITFDFSANDRRMLRFSIRCLKAGANRFDMASGPMAEAVEHSTQHWKDEDLSAVALYLKSLGDREQPPPEALSADTATMRTGALIYEDQCSACHTPDGEGITHLFPRLAQAPLVNSRDATSLIRVVLAGSRAVGTDAAPTAPAMPSFAWNMSDEHIADVLTYVRNSWGNAAAAVSADEVKALREEMKP